MKLNTRSLSETIDSVNDTFFFKARTTQRAREEVSRWIAGRQGLNGSYADMFAPTNRELTGGVRLFTGETIAPSASLRHVSGEEACRALILLNSRSVEVTSALKRATEGMSVALERAEGKGKKMFCCGTCDPALWRHLSVGGLQGAEKWLERGMVALKAHRDATGQWRRFPFYYTLLALSEIDLPQAGQEIRYAGKTCEARLPRLLGPDPISKRRHAVIERALSRC